MRKVLFLLLLMVVASGLATIPAKADTILYTFSWGGGNQGQISGTNPYTGSGIGIDQLEVFNATTSADNTYAITGGSLDFDTSTGLISITGDAGAYGSGTLFSGLINTLTITACTATSTHCDLNFDGSSNLGDFSGYSDAFVDHNGGPWNAFSNYVQALQVTQTPEPASLTLLVSGLALVGGSLRRKLTK